MPPLLSLSLSPCSVEISSPKTTTRKTKCVRRVGFQDCPVIYHVPRWTTIAEHSDVWFTRADFEYFKMRDRILARAIIHDGWWEETSDFCARGLEYLFDDTHRRRCMAQQAVFLAQETQTWRTGRIFDHDEIADAYSRVTITASSAATARGERDAQAAHEDEAIDCYNEEPSLNLRNQPDCSARDNGGFPSTCAFPMHIMPID